MPLATMVEVGAQAAGSSRLHSSWPTRRPCDDEEGEDAKLADVEEGLELLHQRRAEEVDDAEDDRPPPKR